jgi:hypothetical protein
VLAAVDHVVAGCRSGRRRRRAMLRRRVRSRTSARCPSRHRGAGAA